jgi:septum site-determining protein MinC
MAFVLGPEPPIAGWLQALDAQVARSPSFFEGRPVIVDLAGIPPDDPGLASLVGELQARGIRIIAVEGGDPTWRGSEVLTQPLQGGRALGVLKVPDEPPKPAAPPEPEKPGETALVIDRPVRSGQSITFLQGDVTVLGSVSWGAEIIAGGSIHVYGALRGRAIAGFTGNTQARVFCRRMHAELISIDGLYRTAEEMPAALHGRAVQAWLAGDAIGMAALD